MAKKGLLPKHPTHKKVEALMKFLEDHQMEVHEHPYSGLLIIDNEQPELGPIDIRDLEMGEMICSLPAQFEYKLIIGED